tara:strand:+ start:867 stop:1151 length:285 start_codon:yes stop_codon:yes gene_type:complete
MPKDYGQFDESICDLANEITYEISQLVREKLTELNKNNAHLSSNTYVQYNVNSDELDIAVNQFCKVGDVIDAISIVPIYFIEPRFGGQVPNIKK